MHLTLSEINDTAPERCAELLAGVVERAPWLLRDVASARPFRDADAVADVVEAAIRDAGRDARLRLLRGHPELAGVEAAAGAMTAESREEQGRLNLTALTPEARRRLIALNATYRDRFGWPYVVALHRFADIDAIFADAERRLAAPPHVELHTALNEVVSVMRARCRRLFDGEDQPTSVNRAPPPARLKE